MLTRHSKAAAAGEQLRSALPRSSSGLEESPGSAPQDSCADASYQPSVSTCAVWSILLDTC